MVGFVQQPERALSLLKVRVEANCDENNYFSCAIIEGPGGCGKTRLMAHLMNHRNTISLVLYVTKQNKRVQEFVHTDCLSGETDPFMDKPIDLTSSSAHEISDLVMSPDSVGRFAVTAEKLVYALASLSPRAFGRQTSVLFLEIQDDMIKGGPRKYVTEAVSTKVARGRTVIVLMD